MNTAAYFKKEPFIKVEKASYEFISFSLNSGDGEDYPTCTFTACCFGKWITVQLPAIIKPEVNKVYPKWDAATVARLGRDYYYDYTKREYGFTCSEGHVSLKYGRQTDDSSTEQRKGFFLPWMQWKFLRRTIYNHDGSLFANFPERKTVEERRTAWDKEYKAKQEVAKIHFMFNDYDGERIMVSCFIDEREWSRGDSWCSWLRFFFKNPIRKSLELDFSSEVGKRKGSWKGGTMGHSIEMVPCETATDAFKRYCVKEGLTFVSVATDAEIAEHTKPKHIEKEGAKQVKKEENG